MQADNVLIVGAGMVGTWSARAIAKKGFEVMAVDLAPAYGYFQRFSGLSRDRLDGLPQDWAPALREIVQAFDWRAVVNAASVDSNGSGNLLVIDVLSGALRGSATRLVHISSIAVYGASNKQLDESSEPCPRGDYGRAKLAEEYRLCQPTDLDYCILRPCGLFGPIRHGRGSHSARFLEQALRRAIAHGTVEIRGGEQWGDEYLYVRDMADAVAAATDAFLSTDHIINIGSGIITTIDDVANAIREAVPGAEVKIVYDAVEKEPLGAMNIERARSLLQFQPRYSLSNALSECATYIGSAR